MTERVSDWCKCRYCMYQSLLDIAMCNLTCEPCKRENCEKFYDDE